MAGGRRRRVAKIAGLLLGLVVLAVALSPLLLRGRLLRWAVNRATDSLCGDFTLGNGRLGWTFPVDLVLGRPFTLELDDAHIRAPDGSDAIVAARVRARVSIARHPWKITLDDAVATRGRWRLAMGGAPGGSLVDAFRPVPEGGSRATCFEKRPKRGQRAPGPPAAGFSLVVRDLRLEEIDTDLDFPAWGLLLPRVSARGSLSVNPPNGGVIIFEAHDATSPGGALRIGKAGTGGETRAKFDEVDIPHVVVSPDHPTDLVLTVRHGRTGRSNLSGTARFTNIIPPRGPLGPRRLRPQPGMVMDARWTETADMLARLEAGWLPRGEHLEAVGLGGLLVAHLDGTFKELSGAISADGPRAQLKATMERGRRGGVDLHTDGLDVGPLLDARLLPLLDGRVSGRLRASVELAPALADIDASIDEADLVLARAPGGAGPRRLAFRVGPTPRGARVRGPVSTADTLSVALERARLHGGTLTLDGWRARWADVSAGGRLAFSLPPATSTPADAAAPHVDATVDVKLASLSRWVPPRIFDANLTASARVTGPLEHLRARLAFGRASRVIILGETFRTTSVVKATVDGQSVTVSELRLDHDGGGSVAARVRGDLGEDVGGHLDVRGYPLSGVPAFADIKAPDILGAPVDARLADVLEGTLDASFDLHGTVAQPAGTGTATLTSVSIMKRRVNDGRFTVRLAPAHAEVAGSFGPTLSVRGEADVHREGVAATARVAMRGFAPGPWLPNPLDQLASSVTGDARIFFEPKADPRGTGAITFTGPAGELTFDGALTHATASGTVRGHIAVDELRPLWSPFLARAEGGIEIDLRVEALDVKKPEPDRASGTVTITRRLRAQPRGWPLAVDLAEGGRIVLAGPRLRTEGLTITAEGGRAQVRGEVRLDIEAPTRSTLALAAAGELDVGALARQVPPRFLTSASGAATFDARADGPVSAPALSGQARFAAVAVRPALPGWPPLRLDGTVEANGHTLRTRGLRIDTNPHGTLTIGSAAAPASVELLSIDPPRFGQVDVPVAGRGLHFGDASTLMEIRSLDVALNLKGDGRRALALSGDVGIGHARIDPSRGKPGKPGPSKPWYESLPPRLALDLTLHGGDGAISVAVPGPDVSLGFSCRVSASVRGARLDGRLHGSTVYSRMALAVYDWVKSQDVRACRVLKER